MGNRVLAYLDFFTMSSNNGGYLIQTRPFSEIIYEQQNTIYQFAKKHRNNQNQKGVKMPNKISQTDLDAITNGQPANADNVKDALVALDTALASDRSFATLSLYPESGDNTPLIVRSEGTVARHIDFRQYGSGNFAAPVVRMFRGHGTIVAPSPPALDDRLGIVQFFSRDDSTNRRVAE
ncbi:MAG: hypothetical protein AAF653_10735, partial [Chloroflexota bacterium]